MASNFEWNLFNLKVNLIMNVSEHQFMDFHIQISGLTKK